MSAAVLVPYTERCSARGEIAFVVDTLSLPQFDRDEPLRLARGQAAIVPWLGELLRMWEPELVIVETPFAYGRQVPAESFHVIGVLLAVLGQYGARVQRLNPGEWKKLALGAGKGAVKKPAPRCPAGRSHAWPRERDAEGAIMACLACGASYEVLTWARAAGYEGGLWDEADAIGLATAGGVLLERRNRAA